MFRKSLANLFQVMVFISCVILSSHSRAAVNDNTVLLVSAEMRVIYVRNNNEGTMIRNSFAENAGNQGNLERRRQAVQGIVDALQNIPFNDVVAAVYAVVNGGDIPVDYDLLQHPAQRQPAQPAQRQPAQEQNQSIQAVLDGFIQVGVNIHDPSQEENIVGILVSAMEGMSGDEARRIVQAQRQPAQANAPAQPAQPAQRQPAQPAQRQPAQANAPAQPAQVRQERPQQDQNAPAQEQRNKVVKYVVDKHLNQQNSNLVSQEEKRVKVSEEILEDATSLELNESRKEEIKKIVSPILHDVANVENIVQLLQMNVNKKDTKTLEQDYLVAGRANEQQALAYALTMVSRTPEECREIENRRKVSLQSIQQQANHLVVNNAITNRISGISVSPAIVAVASGDSFQPKLHGIWVKGLYATGEQKGVESTARSSNIGASLGADIELNNDNIIGLAYSNIGSDSKYSQVREGDKVKSRSHMLSLYGVHNFNDKLSLDSIFSASIGDINTKRVVVSNDDVIANGKSRSKSFGVQTTVNYRIASKGRVHFVPSLGIRYGYFSEDAYNETGSGVHNQAVGAKSSSVLTATTGINVMMASKLSDSLTIIPSVQVSVSGDILNKSSKVKSQLIWMENYFENNTDASKASKVVYGVGSGITVRSDKAELSVGYNYNGRKESKSHQGSVKLKLLF